MTALWETRTSKRYAAIDQSRNPSVNRAATLDGKPCVIAGALNDFATVRQTEKPAHEVEFSWPTVLRIMATTRQFKS